MRVLLYCKEMLSKYTQKKQFFLREILYINVERMKESKKWVFLVSK